MQDSREMKRRQGGRERNSLNRCSCQSASEERDEGRKGIGMLRSDDYARFAFAVVLSFCLKSCVSLQVPPCAALSLIPFNGLMEERGLTDH
mmetsp:Transcript_14211/g.28503  ORF Transcript_14211/g.28503 Transcript_14211/m.28503 type:complete len:91 (-) Transcript_14211:77-349(-)